QTGPNHGTDGFYFLVAHRLRHFSDADDEVHSRCCQDREPVIQVKLAEQIPGKKRQFDRLYTIRPSTLCHVHRQTVLTSPALKMANKGSVETGFDFKCVPGAFVHRLSSMRARRGHSRARLCNSLNSLRTFNNTDNQPVAISGDIIT